MESLYLHIGCMLVSHQLLVLFDEISKAGRQLYLTKHIEKYVFCRHLLTVSHKRAHEITMKRCSTNALPSKTNKNPAYYCF